MSITHSYNKYTDTYYAYDTTYEWSEELQKKVQHKRCIGKYDPETGEIVPNGKRGRPVKKILAPETPRKATEASEAHAPELEEAAKAAKSLHAKVESIEAMMSRATRELECVRDSLGTLIKQLRAEA